MNPKHLQALIWLRWRLRVNQLKKAGLANTIAIILLTPFLVFLPIVLFVVLFFWGRAIGKPIYVLATWDALVLGFLFIWGITLISDLQRSEGLSLQKFLHLPISLRGVFLSNYFSSLASINMMIFVPAMVGFALGLLMRFGFGMVLVFPLIAGFLFMVSALTYQFQGWLGAMMVNPRRRRTVVVGVTLGFVLLCQLPNLINVFQPWNAGGRQKLNTELTSSQQALATRLAKAEITPETYDTLSKKLIDEHKARLQEAEDELELNAEKIAWYVNAALPPGWLPLGAMSAAEADWLPGLLGLVGLSLIGFGSLRRSYKTTLRLYTGVYSASRNARSKPAPPRALPGAVAPAGLLEKRYSWLAEEPTAIALASFRGLMRAPEAKMMFIAPIMLVVALVAVFYVNQANIGPMLRPLIAFGAMGAVLLCMIQLLGNQFGFDRSGFRVFVLCGIARKYILLGKNLALVPLAAAMGLVVIVSLQFVLPMRWDHFLACFFQFLTMYMLVCLLGNCLSITAPMPIAMGAFKPANPKLVPILLQMLCASMIPVVFSVTLLPIAIEYLVEEFAGEQIVPISLILSAIQMAIGLALYRLILTLQGDWLQFREQRILEIVTSKG